MKIIEIVTITDCNQCDHKRSAPPGIAMTHSWWCGHQLKAVNKKLVSPNGDGIPEWCPLMDIK
jgi:hypothetical protein